MSANPKLTFSFFNSKTSLQFAVWDNPYLNNPDQSFWIFLKHWLKGCSRETENGGRSCSTGWYGLIGGWISLYRTNTWPQTSLLYLERVDIVTEIHDGELTNLTVMTSRILSRLWTLSPGKTCFTTSSVPSWEERRNHLFVLNNRHLWTIGY